MNFQDLLNDLAEFDKTPQSHGYDLRLDLSDIIVRRLNEKGWTQKKLSELAGIREPVLTRIIHAATNCTFESAGKILFALGVRAKLAEIDDRPVHLAVQSSSARNVITFKGNATHGQSKVTRQGDAFARFTTVESSTGGGTGTLREAQSLLA